MSKELNPQILEKSIKHVIDTSGGIKMTDLMVPLCHGLLDEGYEVTGHDVENIIYKMIDAHLISELTYIINGRTKSFLLPHGTEVSGNAILNCKLPEAQTIPSLPPVPKGTSQIASATL